MGAAQTQADGCAKSPSIPLWRVKAYYFASFCYFATYGRYATLYFEADGFSASEIGFMIAITRAISTLSTPFWNALADRTKRARKIQLASLVASSLPFLALALPAEGDNSGLVLRCSAYWSFALLGAPSGAMMDALARAACDQDAERWGQARIYGAVGWGLMHLLLGPLFDRTGFAAMFASFLLCGAVLFIATLAGTPEACSEAKGEVNFKSVTGILVKNRLFFGNLVVLGAGFSMVEGMLFLMLREMEASSLLCGLSVVVTVIFELPIFAYAKPLLERLGTRRMVLLGQAAWVVRAAFYAQMSVAGSVLLIEPLHGVTFALVWTAAIDHVAKPEICGEGLEASAQGLLNACFMGVGPIVGLLAGGMLFDRVGGHAAYATFAVSVSVSGLMYWYYGGAGESAPQKVPSRPTSSPSTVGKSPTANFEELEDGFSAEEACEGTAEVGADADKTIVPSHGQSYDAAEALGRTGGERASLVH
eukprot:TRINITY_DN53356_c0_g1_i1.p1 TRINITY_DN53356_c0_g1~~TRINITY_DN53356_c0_g1_i1.p1  ORF type:complete len:497 (-),score=88.94 TRINITY_DN53356_c0_g1_i1:47-1480(-)